MAILNFKWPSGLGPPCAIIEVLISHRVSGIKKKECGYEYYLHTCNSPVAFFEWFFL